MTFAHESLRQALAAHYRIERELGRGGTAIVYVAEDLKHPRRVAMKVMSPEVASIGGPERFLCEIESAARLTHLHILPLHRGGRGAGVARRRGGARPRAARGVIQFAGWLPTS